MDIKKYPKKKLENYSKIFFQIGLVLTLFVVYKTIEHKTYEKVTVKDLGTVTFTSMMTEEIPIVTFKKPKNFVPKKTPPVIAEVFEVVEDEKNVEEEIIETTESDEDDEVIIYSEDDIAEAREGEVIVEDIPFMKIERVPIFPGCKGNNSKLRDCFTEKTTRFINKKFNVGLSQELGLSTGRKRIYVVFTVNNKGLVSDVKARAPHPRLEKEALRVINALPKMIPGKQRDKPVNVQYSIPITFDVR
jgi:protein TonB